MLSREEVDQLDREDLSQARAGSQDALARLIERYRGPISRLATLMAREPSCAEDVTQEALLSVSRNLEGYRAEGSVRAWIMMIARNAALRSGRLRAGQPAEMLEFEDSTPLVELGAAAGWGQSPPNPEVVTLAHERRALLREGIASLGPADRVILQLKDIEGLTYEEVSRVLEIPVATAKTRLHRARLRLMEALLKRGLP